MFHECKQLTFILVIQNTGCNIFNRRNADENLQGDEITRNYGFKCCCHGYMHFASRNIATYLFKGVLKLSRDVLRFMSKNKPM